MKLATALATTGLITATVWAGVSAQLWLPATLVAAETDINILASPIQADTKDQDKQKAEIQANDSNKNDSNKKESKNLVSLPQTIVGIGPTELPLDAESDAVANFINTFENDEKLIAALKPSATYTVYVVYRDIAADYSKATVATGYDIKALNRVNQKTSSSKITLPSGQYAKVKQASNRDDIWEQWASLPVGNPPATIIEEYTYTGDGELLEAVTYQLSKEK
ncbi:hypothetical protein C9I98_19325 [Photobacterium sanctipauli]|uniref:AraC family transcriptional regulator n=1 Tax=Photobacterium sanctipauli TaxID=1342794 RepID=A0A2T3NNW8_9GAMM|nr:hypothetical protein [Photobacterium sanctipauli]PSW17668.1 hypothetical protein C9I98_19325 [Photobacterium sanctipauli]